MKCGADPAQPTSIHRPSLDNTELITQKYHILSSVNYEPGIHTPTDRIQAFKRRLFLWCQQQQQPLVSQRPLLVLVPAEVLDRAFWSSHSLCTPGRVMREARHGSSGAPSGSVSKWLESACGDTTSTRFVWHAPPSILPSFFARLLHWWVLFHSPYLRHKSAS